jgi:hypothetical protein
VCREGRLTRLTDDHTVAAVLAREGSAVAPGDHQRLLQAVGTGNRLDVAFYEVPLADEDVLLLCTDGLVRALPEARIADRVDGAALETVAGRLLDAARQAGAGDNVAVTLARVGVDRDRVRAERLGALLREVFLLRDLTETERMEVAPWLEERVVEKGGRLLREGDEAAEFFLVVEGRVRISRGEVRLTDVGPGAHLGELALARKATRSASATALERTWLLALSRDRFHEICRRKPEIGAKLAVALLDAVGDRLRDLTDRLAAVERAVRGERT